MQERKLPSQESRASIGDGGDGDVKNG